MSGKNTKPPSGPTIKPAVGNSVESSFDGPRANFKGQTNSKPSSQKKGK